MKLVSIDYLPGCELEVLGLVKGAVVYSKSFGKDFMAGMKNLVGGEIKGYTEMLADARAIADPDARVAEYRDLERVIAQEDAAWIPLFSRFYTYVTSPRLEGFQTSWNGSVKNKYREMSIKEA